MSEQHPLRHQEQRNQDRFPKLRKMVRRGKERLPIHPDTERQAEQIAETRTALQLEGEHSQRVLPDSESSTALQHLPDHEREVINDPNLPVVWPHEERSIDREKRKLHRNPLRLIATSYQNIIETGMNRFSLSGYVMERINGKEAKSLANKYEFIKIIHDMGYPAPEQTLVQRDQPLGENVEKVIDHFPDGNQDLICKPLYGAGGKGIVEMKADDIKGFLSTIKTAYIVQEKVPINGEIRYMRQINTHSGVIRRVYDEKDIPKLESEGDKTKWDLIRESNLPLSAKLATTIQNIKSLKTVVPNGGAIHISRLGVPHKEILEWNPEKRQRVENMDKFMQQFITDLQTKIGQQLPVLCFDIGVKDMSVLDQPYDFEAIKSNLVPFECQVPFTVNGYIARSGNSIADRVRMFYELQYLVQNGDRKDFIKE